MDLFHESPQRHKALDIPGPQIKGLRFDPTHVETEIILMPLLYFFEHSFEIKGPSEFFLATRVPTVAPCSQKSTPSGELINTK